MKKGLIKNSLLLMSLFGVLAQASYAACPATCTSVEPCNASLDCASACLEKVEIPKKHWWSRKRTGYRVVFKGKAIDCCTGCAAPIQEKGLTLIPKKWFWEKDKLEQRP